MRKEIFVRKTLYSWDRLILLFLAQARVPQKEIVQVSLKKKFRLLNRGLLLLALASLWWWNWQLLFSTSIGIGLMWLTYKVPPRQWRKLGQKLMSASSFTFNENASFARHNRKLVFTVIGGSLGGAIAYMTTAIWANAENHWLAVGSILQGFGTLILLILVAWQINRTATHSHNAKFERLLGDLTAPETLKRLIAIRQLTNLAQHKALEREQKLQLMEYFHFMLTETQEVTLQEALFDGLATLGVSAQSFYQPQSFSQKITPLKLQNVKDLA